MTDRGHSFRAMGTEVRLIADAASDEIAFDVAAGRLEAVFDGEERRFSRFRADSELSRVNSRAGGWSVVSRPFAELTRRALEWAAESEGLFDPTILPALLSAGYDRDFDEVLAGARGALNPPVPCGRWDDVRLVDFDLFLPEGVGLDFGGIAKGWTVDLAARDAYGTGLAWVLVNAGGDLRMVGEPREVEIGIEDPFDRSAELARIVVSEGAIATSSTQRRTWGPGLHHLIDPRTGEPASTGVVQATVWAPTCEEAEVRAKCALMSGVDVRPLDHSVLVTDSGEVLVNLDQRAVA